MTLYNLYDKLRACVCPTQHTTQFTIFINFMTELEGITILLKTQDSTQEFGYNEEQCIS